MFAYIFLLIVSIVLIVNSFHYFFRYFIIKRTGLRTKGLVVSFTTCRQFMIKNALIPKISFSTRDNRRVINMPLYSFFIELVGYKLNREYDIVYAKDNPNKFIVIKPTEFGINLLVILSSLAYTTWFIFSFILS